MLHRTQGLLDVSAIGKLKVVFLGLGSLGSLAAGNLAYPFRQIVLVDPEALEEDNVERHLLGQSEIGKPKAEGVRSWLIDRGIDPSRIVTHVGYAQEALESHTDADLLVVSIDNRRANEDVNAWAMAHNVPALYGAIYPMGTGGHVFVLPSPSVACYKCALRRVGGDVYVGKPTSDYGVNIAELLDPEGNLHRMPALRWAINTIASDMAGLALEILTKGGEVQPQIYVHAHAWESVLVNLHPGKVLNDLAAFVGGQTALGLIPNWQLGKLAKGYELKIKRGSVSLALEQWKECPLHSSSISSDEI